MIDYSESGLTPPSILSESLTKLTVSGIPLYPVVGTIPLPGNRSFEGRISVSPYLINASGRLADGQKNQISIPVFPGQEIVLRQRIGELPGEIITEKSTLTDIDITVIVSAYAKLRETRENQIEAQLASLEQTPAFDNLLECLRTSQQELPALKQKLFEIAAIPEFGWVTYADLQENQGDLSKKMLQDATVNYLRYVPKPEITEQNSLTTFIDLIGKNNDLVEVLNFIQNKVFGKTKHPLLQLFRNARLLSTIEQKRQLLLKNGFDFERLQHKAMQRYNKLRELSNGALPIDYQCVAMPLPAWVIQIFLSDPETPSIVMGFNTTVNHHLSLSAFDADGFLENAQLTNIERLFTHEAIHGAVNQSEQNMEDQSGISFDSSERWIREGVIVCLEHIAIEQVDGRQEADRTFEQNYPDRKNDAVRYYCTAFSILQKYIEGEPNVTAKIKRLLEIDRELKRKVEKRSLTTVISKMKTEFEAILNETNK